jgi:hypothetical protein
VLAAALGRLVKLLLGALVGSAVVALPIGLALGATPARALSLGWYCVGSFLLIAGFFVGNRGPARSSGGWSPLSLRGRVLRWATPDEQEESINLSAVLIVLGIALILLGIAADTRYSLF